MSTEIVHKAAGNTVSVEAGDIILDQAGIVRLKLGPEQVARFERVGDDLQLVLKDGRTITIRNFFLVDEDGERHDLVLEDADGVLWWGQYTSPWSEFHFTEIQLDAAAAAVIPDASGGFPAWAGVVLGVIGGAALLARGGSDSDDPPAAGNRAPTADSSAHSIAEDGLLQARVTAQDPDGDALTYALGSEPSNGIVVVNRDGTYTYTPDADFHGTDSFTVTVTDGRGGTSTATITVTVTPVNDAPTATAPPLTVDEDGTATGTIAGNDVDGDTLTYTVTTPPEHGTLVIDPDTGNYTYTPDPDYNGPDSFTVTVDDGNGGTTTVEVPVTVTPVNDPPVATAPPVTTDEDMPATGTIAGSDVDGDTLTYTVTTPPEHGTLVIDPDTGNYTYTPDPDYNGPDSFTVTVDDGNGGTTTVDVPVTVSPINDAPVANDDGPVVVIEDTPVSGNVLDNDSDVDGDNLVVTQFTVAGDPTVYDAGQTANIPGVGTLVIDADGGYSFTPAPDYDGTVPTATYTVSDGSLTDTGELVFADITPVNDAPVAPPIVTTTDEDAAGFSVDLLAGASDVEGDPLTVANLVETSGNDASGVSMVGDTLVVDPAAYNHLAEGESITLVYSYDVSDGQGGVTATTATVVIEGRNDAPVMESRIATGDGIVVKPSTSTNHSIDDALSLDGLFVLGSNPDIENSATVPFVSIHGTGGGTGADYYAFTVTEAGTRATFDVDYGVEPPGPFDSYLHLWDADGNRIARNDDSSTGNGGAGSTNPLDAYLSHTFTEPGTYYISIGNYPGSSTPDNPVPAGAGYQLQVSLENAITRSAYEADLTDHTDHSTADLSASGTIAFTDDDLNDSHSVTVDLVSATHSVTGPGATPAGGLAAVIGDSAMGDGAGTVDWTFATPEADIAYLAAGESLVQVYRVTVTDSSGATSSQEVTITLHGTNDAPVLSSTYSNAFVVAEDASYTGAIGGVTDPEGDSLAYTLLDAPAHGSLSLGVGGSYLYTPAPDFHGTDSFTVRVQDGNGGFVDVVVDIVVEPRVDIEDDTTATNEGVPVTIDVLANDSFDDPGRTITAVDGQAIADGETVTLESGQGTVSLVGGQLVFTPAAGVTGPVDFEYTVTSGGVTETATVTVNVNSAPVFEDDGGDPVGAGGYSFSYDENSAVGTVLGTVTASDAEGDALTYTIVSGNDDGWFAIDASGRITLTAAGAASVANDYEQGVNAHSLVVRASDPSGASTTVNVTLNELDINDAPVAANDVVTVQQNASLAIPVADLLDNDNDQDVGDTLTITGVADGTGGTVTLVGGAITFTPDLDFAGAATFTYTVSDGNGGTDTATVTVNVTPVAVESVSSPWRLEGQLLVFDIGLDVLPEGANTVQFTLGGGTATPGVDTGAPVEVSLDGGTTWSTVTLEDGSYSVLVPAGVQNLQVRVPALEDDLVEPDETINLEAWIGDTTPVTGTGTIVDTTPQLVQPPAEGDNVLEGGSGNDLLLGDDASSGGQAPTAPGVDYNIALLLDVSTSMMRWVDSDTTTTGSNTRLALMKAALADFLPSLLEHDGVVNIALATFGTGTGTATSIRLTVDDLQEGNLDALLDAIDALAISGTQYTNYEAGFELVVDWFESMAPSTPGFQNLTYFITDGDPTRYLSGTGGAGTPAGTASEATREVLQESVDAFYRPGGLNEISEVHAIGIGPSVNTSFLQFFDNTPALGGSITVDVSPATRTLADFQGATGPDAPANWAGASADAVAATVDSGRLVLDDATAGNGAAAVYHGPTLLVTEADAYLSFEYRHADWAAGDTFTWQLQRLDGGEWVAVGSGTNAQTNTGATTPVTMRSPIVGPGTYRYVFEVEDSAGGGNYRVQVDNIQVNHPDGADTVTGGAGQVGNPQVIMTADQLTDALRGSFGNDTIDGGAGNDILFGDAMSWVAHAGIAAGSGLEALRAALQPSLGREPEYEDLYQHIRANHAAFNSASTQGGNDVLDGGLGDDILFGQGGDDILRGGQGNDILYGGAGADTFVWEVADMGHDVIRDFDAGQGDRIDLAGLPSNFSVHYEVSGADTVIVITEHDGAPFGTITVENTSQAQLQAPGAVLAPAAPAIMGFGATPLGLDALDADGHGMARAAALPKLDELLSDGADAHSLDALLPDGGARPPAYAGAAAPYAPVPANPLDELEQPVLDMV